MTEQTEETEEAVKRALVIRAQGMPVGERGLVLRTVADMTVFSKLVFDTGLAPSGFKSAQQIFVAVQMGAELGLAPMASLRTIAVINGRPAVWGGGLMGVVEASGVLEWKKEWLDGLDKNGNPTDSTIAYCETKRIGKAAPVKTAFSVEDAKKAGLWGDHKDNWKKYPKRMLQMRARSRNLNDEFADVLHGLLTAEEVEDIGTFDADKVNGAKRTEVLTQRIAESVPAEAGVNAANTPESTGKDPVDQSGTPVEILAPVKAAVAEQIIREVDKHGNVFSGTEGTGIHVEGPDVPKIEDSKLPEHGKRPGDPIGAAGPSDGVVDPKPAEVRFASLVQHIEAEASVTMAKAEKLARAWLKKLGYRTIEALADNRFDKLIWPKAQKVDWKELAA